MTNLLGGVPLGVPSVVAAACGFMAVAGSLAALVPAAQAASVDPIEACEANRRDQTSSTPFFGCERFAVWVTFVLGACRMKRRPMKSSDTKQDSGAKASTRPVRRLAVPVSPDLSKGVIVVLSGGGFDAMNPVEVRERMEEYISDVNDDVFVKAATGGQGLTYKLLSGQKTKHLHQTKWKAICEALSLREATPLILVGHSNGGAAAVDLARCLKSQGKSVDLLFSADSVLTLDDNGDVNAVPANVKLNINPYVKPTPAWILLPFPIGRTNRREADSSLDGILNVGLKFNLPGAIAHRNAFYDLAGGDKHGTTYTYPRLLLDATIAVLRGQSNDSVIAAVVDQLRTLATASETEIHVATWTRRSCVRKRRRITGM